MKVSGQFTTSSSVDALRTLDTRPQQLASVLAEVEAGPDGSLNAVFSPATPFGRVPITVRIVPEGADDHGARLRVHGRRGPHVFDVQLTLGFFPDTSTGTAVIWEAEVDVRGPAASVAQRVASDVARRAIGDVLTSAANCAGTE